MQAEFFLGAYKPFTCQWKTKLRRETYLCCRILLGQSRAISLNRRSIFLIACTYKFCHEMEKEIGTITRPEVENAASINACYGVF